jgi:hypothetical protein
MLRNWIRKNVVFEIEVDAGYPYGELDDDEVAFGPIVSTGCTFVGTTVRDVQSRCKATLDGIEKGLEQVEAEIREEHPNFYDAFYIGCVIVPPKWLERFLLWIDDTLNVETYVKILEFLDNWLR